MMRSLSLVWSFMVCVLLLARGAHAEERPAWTADYPQIDADIAAGRPLTVLVVVPLCDSKLIACGGERAGDPGSLDKNLYWGRAFGVRRFFDESAKRFQRIAQTNGQGPLLEQLVYRRMVPGAPWSSATDVEQLVVLRAIHGARIDDAVRDFYRFATEGAEVSFVEHDAERRVRVHVAGYAGHNRLLDGASFQQLLGQTKVSTSATPLPSFVFACRSAPYFERALREHGSRPLVMTRDLMAPEGYIIEAMARGLGERATPQDLRQRVVTAYAKWQRIPERTASAIFARVGR